MTTIDRQQAESLRSTRYTRARSLLVNRPNNKDEILFLAATSDALLSIDSSQYPTVNLNNSGSVALSTNDNPGYARFPPKSDQKYAAQGAQAVELPALGDVDLRALVC